MPTAGAVIPGFSSRPPVADAGNRPVSTRTTPGASAGAAGERHENACGAAAPCRAPTRRSAGALCAIPAPASSTRSSGAATMRPTQPRTTLLPRSANPASDRPVRSTPRARSAAGTGAWPGRTNPAKPSVATAYPAWRSRIPARTADAASPGAEEPGAGSARSSAAGRA